ncbi:MAG TPA: helix-turn-helix domain-containing protein [Spirochaetota bacterium]|nr:helix-turn-helix domain-containing protein [Spirochaetota bacterium]HOH38305.1 helix-turn-helix domain-containing protein [Spirochaetota bacterium]HPJ15472.1 helix-turn-helix domain-containing protein [Spirochaetota bacterium]HPM35245.1 helix-turn-helix domain-containing protein [Spirochaetota bacterium]HPW52370.1 helix-turn-helix domain-containing protein [Spirochaetota bacterium]
MILFNGKKYNCEMELTIDLVGGKWKSMILWIISGRTVRFNALRRELHGITQKMLTQQLRELEADGLLNRKVYAEVPPKVEYTLTEQAKNLLPVLEQLCEWGKKYAEGNRKNHISEKY